MRGHLLRLLMGAIGGPSQRFPCWASGMTSRETGLRQAHLRGTRRRQRVRGDLALYAASEFARTLALLTTTTKAVHHRCITATAFGAHWRNRRPSRKCMVEPKLALRGELRRRIRLRGLAKGETPQFA